MEKFTSLDVILVLVDITFVIVNERSFPLSFNLSAKVLEIKLEPEPFFHRSKHRLVILVNMLRYFVY